MTQIAGELHGVTCYLCNLSRNIFVARNVARSRTQFYFLQRLQQLSITVAQCNHPSSNFQSPLHSVTTPPATFNHRCTAPGTCLTIFLQYDQERMRSSSDEVLPSPPGWSRHKSFQVAELALRSVTSHLGNCNDASSTIARQNCSVTLPC